jgi:hypothetical protein
MLGLLVTQSMSKGVWVQVLVLHYFLHDVVARRSEAAVSPGDHIRFLIN